MTIYKIFIVLILFAFCTAVYSQTDTPAKIQYRVDETHHYTKNTVDLKYKLNFFIDDQFAEGPYDETFFKKHFKSSERALDFSLDFLELDHKAKWTKRKARIFGGALMVAGLGSFLLLSDNKGSGNIIAGATGLVSGLTVSLILNRKHHKQKKLAYQNLDNALLAYREDNPAAYKTKKEVDNDSNSDNDRSDSEGEVVDLNDEIKFSLRSTDLRKVAYKSIDINFINGKFSRTRRQYIPGLGFNYMKNGIFFNGTLGLPVYDTNRLFTKSEYEFEHSPLIISNDPEAYPIDLSLPYAASLTAVVPFKTYVKEGAVLTTLAQNVNGTLMARSRAKILRSFGVQFGTEMENSTIYNSAGFDDGSVFEANTNDLNINIANPSFLRRSVNLSGGVSATFFTTYELKPEFKGLDESYSVVNWFRFYVIAKYNVSSSVADMYYKGRTPVTFDNIEEKSVGYALGLASGYLNKNKGLTFALEVGSNPRISEAGYSDLYVSLLLGYSLGWF